MNKKKRAQAERQARRQAEADREAAQRRFRGEEPAPRSVTEWRVEENYYTGSFRTYVRFSDGAVERRIISREEMEDQRRYELMRERMRAERARMEREILFAQQHTIRFHTSGNTTFAVEREPQIDTRQHPTLIAALESELADMRQRIATQRWTADYEDYRRRTARPQSILERRYELSRRCWRMARGDFGPGRAALRQMDDDGKLYEVSGAPARLLLVICPSMKKPHVLYVPKTMQTAREARAWTFGLEAEAFDVGVET